MISPRLWVDPEQAAHFELTSDQVSVLTALAKGMTQRQTARALHLSEHTVSVHIADLFARLGVSNATTAVAVAYDFGVLRTRATRVALAQEAGLHVVHPGPARPDHKPARRSA